MRIALLLADIICKSYFPHYNLPAAGSQYQREEREIFRKNTKFWNIWKKVEKDNCIWWKAIPFCRSMEMDKRKEM
jgi:hypothetical protein